MQALLQTKLGLGPGSVTYRFCGRGQPRRLGEPQFSHV